MLIQTYFALEKGSELHKAVCDGVSLFNEKRKMYQEVAVSAGAKACVVSPEGRLMGLLFEGITPKEAILWERVPLRMGVVSVPPAGHPVWDVVKVIDTMGGSLRDVARALNYYPDEPSSWGPVPLIVFSNPDDDVLIAGDTDDEAPFRPPFPCREITASEWLERNAGIKRRAEERANPPKAVPFTPTENKED
jgi:hypothetical protein